MEFIMAFGIASALVAVLVVLSFFTERIVRFLYRRSALVRRVFAALSLQGVFDDETLSVYRR